MADKTPMFDWERGEFVQASSGEVATATGGKSILEIAIKALETERGIFLIYATPNDEETDHKYGSEVISVAIRSDLDEENKIAEVERAIREALVYLDGITDVIDMIVYREGTDSLRANFTLVTDFDEKIVLEGVPVYG